jgi:hypothetical protein
MNLSGLELLILILALWRMSCLLIMERGFGDIFLILREAIGIKHTDDGRPNEIPDTNWGRLFSCTWCMSMFLAIPLSLLVYLFRDVMIWISLPFAVSAGAIMIDKYFG